MPPTSEICTHRLGDPRTRVSAVSGPGIRAGETARTLLRPKHIPYSIRRRNSRDLTPDRFHQRCAIRRPRNPSAATPPAKSETADARTLLPWYEGGLRFTCTQCGNCCTGAPGFVWVDDEDLQKIADHLGKPVGEIRLMHTKARRPRGSSLTEFANGDCTFFDGATRKCTIYPSAAACRTWPFWNSNLESPEAWNDILPAVRERGAPAVLAGRNPRAGGRGSTFDRLRGRLPKHGDRQPRGVFQATRMN